MTQTQNLSSSLPGDLASAQEEIAKLRAKLARHQLKAVHDYGNPLPPFDERFVHELSQPLTAECNYVSAARWRCAACSGQADILDKASAQMQRATSMIEQLRDSVPQENPLF